MDATFMATVQARLGVTVRDEDLAAQVVRLRRLVAEPTAETYTDEAVATFLVETVVTEMHTDLAAPGATDRRQTVQPVVFDLHAAAARIWEEKLAALVGAGTYDYSADGQSFSLSHLVEQYKQRLSYHLARRRVTSIRMVTRRAAPDDDRSWNG